MPRYDLCLAWNWDYDADFAYLLEAACMARGLSLLQVTPENLIQVLTGMESSEITFSAFFDRASEADDRFLPVTKLARRNGAFRINPQEQSLWAEDKATMHLEFISRGLTTPFTIILPPHAEQPQIQAPDLSVFGEHFAIKPAHGGSGEGVIARATSPEQIHTARQQHPDEKYLLQAYVIPQLLGSRPAWFRVLSCAGAIYPCWWDPQTHVYARLTAGEKAGFNLRNLSEVTARIAAICKLELFSTEIAVDANNRFLIVDYVNDQIDLRLQSKAGDGVPDTIVLDIAGRLTRLVERYCPLP